MNDSIQNIPVATQWTLDAMGEVGRTTIPHVFMIVCPNTGSKGSGFLLSNGYIVTNLHVVRGAQLNQIYAISSIGEKINFSKWYYDPTERLDLILLKPFTALNGGLTLDLESEIKVGESVQTLGYPLGYNGPAPLLSVGYLSGFREINNNNKIFKHYVVNGAFNNGNSGGALFKSGENKVIGIVVSKHFPLSEFHRQSIEVLAKNQAGVVYTAKNSEGQEISFVESQIVADILKAYQHLVQVMIGEAICAIELANLLRDLAIKLHQEAVAHLDVQQSLILLQEARDCIQTIFPEDVLLKEINSQINSRLEVK